MLHQCLPWQTNLSPGGDWSDPTECQSTDDLGPPRICSRHSSGMSGRGAGNAVGRQEGFFYLSGGGESRNRTGVIDLFTNPLLPNYRLTTRGARRITIEHQ